MSGIPSRVLVLAPHTDDGEFGCGGTIAKFLEQGREVYYAAFSTAEKSVPPGMPKDVLKTEVKEATRRLGIPPANLIIYATYQDDRAAGWLSERTGIPAVGVPLTVGGTDNAKDLFSFYDDLLSRMLAGLQ